MIPALTFFFGEVEEFLVNLVQYNNLSAGSDDIDWTKFEHSPVAEAASQSDVELRIYSSRDSNWGFSLTAYPNPSADIFSINLEGDYGNDVQYQVHDISGRLVFRRPIIECSIQS